MKEFEVMFIKKALQEWRDNDFISKDLFQQLSEDLKGAGNEEAFSNNSSRSFPEDFSRGFPRNTFIEGLMEFIEDKGNLALLLTLLCGVSCLFNLPYIVFIFIAVAILKGPGHLFQGSNGSEEPFLGERLTEFAHNRRNLVSFFFVIFTTVFCLIFLPTPCVFEILPFIAVAILGSIAYLCQLPQVWLLALLYLLLAWIMSGYGKGAFTEFTLPGVVFILLSTALKRHNKLNIFAKKTFWCGVFCLALAFVYFVTVDNDLAHSIASNFWFSLVMFSILILLSI
jgi:hypothetical protein